jgi:hypothetical protein
VRSAESRNPRWGWEKYLTLTQRRLRQRWAECQNRFAVLRNKQRKKLNEGRIARWCETLDPYAARDEQCARPFVLINAAWRYLPLRVRDPERFAVARFGVVRPFEAPLNRCERVVVREEAVAPRREAGSLTPALAAFALLGFDAVFVRVEERAAVVLRPPAFTVRIRLLADVFGITTSKKPATEWPCASQEALGLRERRGSYLLVSTPLRAKGADRPLMRLPY